jgi:hypothetical protein
MHYIRSNLTYKVFVSVQSQSHEGPTFLLARAWLAGNPQTERASRAKFGCFKKRAMSHQTKKT